MMKDEIVFKEKKLSTRCSSCESYDHSILDCSMVTPHFNKFRTVIKHIFPVIQKRQAIIRERVKFQTYKRNSVVRDDLKKVRNQLALKFMDSAEIDEVSDENDYSDDDENYHSDEQKNHVNDDKEYFMKQRMQFRQIDGQIVNYESENTHNYFTDEYQSLIVDNMNQIILQNGQPFNNQQINGYEINQSQNNSDPIPDIIVQRKDKKQLSIIKNNFNPHMRSNSTIQKQSLFRMESQAAQSSDIQKEDLSQRRYSNIIKQGQNHTIPSAGTYTSVTGQNPQEGLNKNEENIKKQKNFDTQATYENISNVGYQNNQGVNTVQNEYLTQQNIGLGQNTVNSTPHRSIDQSQDENKNKKSTTSQSKKQNSKKKQSLTSDQLQQVSEKLQILHQKQNEKQRKKDAKQQKKRVSIQIDGKVKFQDNHLDSSELDDNSEEEDKYKNKQQSHVEIEDEYFWSSDTKNSKPKQQTRKNSKELDLTNFSGYKSPKSAISAPYPSPPIETFLINVIQNTEEYQNKNQDKLEDNQQQKINQKIKNYHGGNIAERMSEQSVQELEISQHSQLNNQKLRQKSRENSNNSNKLSKLSMKTPTKQINLETNIRDDLRIDINSLHEYNDDSSQSIPQQRLRNSLFYDFYKSQSSSMDAGDEPQNSPSPKLKLDPSVIKEQERQTLEAYNLNQQDQPIESDEYDLTEGHPTPVGTPSHRRITIQAERLFGQKSRQQDHQYDIEEESSMSHQETHNTPLDSDSPQHMESQAKIKNRTNNLQLTSVQEILTRNSNDDDIQNNSSNNKRKFSIKSSISKQSKDKDPPYLLKSTSHNYQQNLQSFQNISQNIFTNNQLNSNEVLINNQNPNNQFVQRQNSNQLNDVNHIISNNNNLFQNFFLSDNDKQTPINKNPINIPIYLSDQQILHSQASINQNSQTSGVINYIPKEQINRQSSLNQNQSNQFNTTTEMRKTIAKNKAKNKKFSTLHDENVQGAALYGIHQYGQAPMNSQPKQYHPLQGTRLKAKNPSQIQSHVNPNTPSNGISQSRKNIVYPPIADSFSQQVLYHQKYFQTKNKARNSIQLQHGQSIVNQGNYQGVSNDNIYLGGGGITPKRRHQTMMTRFNTKGQQLSTTYSQQNTNSAASNHNSLVSNNRGRNPSWNNNNNHLPIINNLQIRSESQNNIPLTEEQYEEDINEYETVSNADLYIYNFDLMKEYKKYYPQHNFKKVLNDCLRKRKPFVQNKSIHNNTFIQKIMQKKKKIPRRLPSLMKQFDVDFKTEQ